MPASPLRVVLFGTESTGKSTLAEKLAKHFGEPWAGEYVREYWDSHDGRIGPNDLEAIARGQAAAEDSAKDGARRVYFCDTDLLTHTMWDDILFAGECPRWAYAEAESRAKSTDLFLFCRADIEWEPDPQRCFPEAEQRSYYDRYWLRALETRGLPYILIEGDWQTREKTAIQAVEKLLLS